MVTRDNATEEVAKWMRLQPWYAAALRWMRPEAVTKLEREAAYQGMMHAANVFMQGANWNNAVKAALDEQSERNALYEHLTRTTTHQADR